MDSEILFIGHRGCAGQFPENTLAAFRRAGRHLPALEVDVQRCGSGELIAFHDETLDRLTGGSGAVAGTPWERIADLEVLDSGESIPRFDSVLDAWPSGVTMNLDIHDATVVREALHRIRMAGFSERVILSSTDPEALERAGEWRSGTDAVDVALGYSFRDDIAAGITTAAGLDCTFVHVPTEMCTGTSIVERAHGAGMAVDAWTVRTHEAAERAATCGVDAMTVDRWEFRTVA